jgi:hypothetical protein
MITGFNTDIKHKGVVYHVQTEDKGLKNPKVETLVYKGGTILHAKRTSYQEVLHIERLQEVVTKLMQEQHQRVIQEIRSGKFEKREEPAARPDQSKTLDQLILDYLASNRPEDGR